MRFAKDPVVNPEVAKLMRGFFRGVRKEARADPDQIARQYARFLWTDQRAQEGHFRAGRYDTMYDHRFHLGLSLDETDLETFTKRTTLISDALVLQHRTSRFHRLEIPEIHLTPYRRTVVGGRGEESFHG